MDRTIRLLVLTVLFGVCFGGNGYNYARPARTSANVQPIVTKSVYYFADPGSQQNVQRQRTVSYSQQAGTLSAYRPVARQQPRATYVQAAPQQPQTAYRQVAPQQPRVNYAKPAPQQARASYAPAAPQQQFSSQYQIAPVIHANNIDVNSLPFVNSNRRAAQQQVRYRAPQVARPQVQFSAPQVAPKQVQYAAPQQVQYAAPQPQVQYSASQVAPQQVQYAAPKVAQQQVQYAAPQVAQQQVQYAAPQVAPQPIQYAAPQPQVQYSAPQVVPQQVQYAAAAPQVAQPQVQYTAAQQVQYTVPQQVQYAGPQQASVAKQNVQVIFVKAPGYEDYTEALLKMAQESAQAQTVVYVLSKEPDVAELTRRFKEIQSTVPKMPEVRFIKYKTEDEAIKAQEEIQAQYDNLPGPSQSFGTQIGSVIGGNSASGSSNSNYSNNNNDAISATLPLTTSTTITGPANNNGDDLNSQSFPPFVPTGIDVVPGSSYLPPNQQ